MMKKEMLSVFLMIGFFTLATISPILGQEPRKFDVVLEGKGLKGDRIRLINSYAFFASLSRHFSLSGDVSLNDSYFKFTNFFIIDSDVERVINIDFGGNRVIDQDFTICGFLNKDEVNYLVIKNRYQASCHDIVNSLGNSYDDIIAMIEEKKAEAKAKEAKAKAKDEKRNVISRFFCSK